MELSRPRPECASSTSVVVGNPRAERKVLYTSEEKKKEREVMKYERGDVVLTLYPGDRQRNLRKVLLSEFAEAPLDDTRKSDLNLTISILTPIVLLFRIQTTGRNLFLLCM
jgi:hypothetical protein